MKNAQKYDIEKLMKEHGSIGAFVKKADNSFKSLTRKTKLDGNFNRIDWQFINFIYTKKTVSTQGAKNFLSFFEPDELLLNVYLQSFEDKGVVIIKNDTVSLTEKGGEVHTELAGLQKDILEKSFSGISAEDYITAISVLQKMIENSEEFIENNTN